MSSLLPFQAHSETSRLAALAMAQGAAPLRWRVYRTLLALGPQTDEELTTSCNLHPSTLRPRRVELVRMGLAQESGVRKKTLSGRFAVVWEALPVSLTDDGETVKSAGEDET